METFLNLLLHSDAIEFMFLIFCLSGTAIYCLRKARAHELQKIEKLALLKASTEFDQEIKNELAKLE